MAPEELDAYGRLAEQISRSVRAWASCEQNGSRQLPTPHFYHECSSTLELLAEAATKIGILVPVSGTPADCYFAYAIEHERVYSHAVSAVTERPAFDELLGAFIYYVQEHGGGFRAYPPEHSFPVCIEMDSFFRSLVKIGYAERAGLEYRWTVKAAPAMFHARIWPLGTEPDAYFRRTGRM